MKLLHVVGARPNFPKLAPVHRAGVRAGVEQVIVHTGQHYDELLSEGFFRSLGIPAPDVNLAVGRRGRAGERDRLVTKAHVVVTDSGGLQEETTALGIPCLTLRPNTERPVTITEGTNQLVGDPARLPALVRAATRNGRPRRPDGWDGNAGVRVIDTLLQRENNG